MRTQLCRLATAFLFIAPLALAGCHQAAPMVDMPLVDKAAIDAKIRELDADWVKVAATRSADAWDAFYADDAVVLPPNDKTATDKAKIKQSVAGLLSLSAVNITWTDDKVVVADAGDMAYTYGTYALSAMGPDGKPINDKGKTLEIWRKQADGSWKCVVDTWSSDLPAAS